MPEPLRALERRARQQAAAGRGRAVQRLHALRQAESVPRLNLELLHAEGPRQFAVAGPRRVAPDAEQPHQLVLSGHAGLPERLLQLNLPFKHLPLQRGGLGRGALLRLRGFFGRTAAHGAADKIGRRAGQHCGTCADSH